MSSPLWKYSTAVAGLLIAMSVTAEAQVCGDADGSGTVTVTDGVNVLRKAAGLLITEACRGDVNQQVKSLLRSSLEIFGALTKTGASSARIAQAQPCDNDGTFEDFENSRVFFDCQIDDVIFDGTISSPSPNVIEFDSLDLIDPVTDDSFLTIESGTLSVRNVNGNLVLSGPLKVSTSDLDDFLSITFVNVVVNADGFILDGALDLDVTNAGIEGVVAIRLGLTDSTLLPVTVIFDNKTTLQFTFDTVSGELTPVSN